MRTKSLEQSIMNQMFLSTSSETAQLKLLSVQVSDSYIKLK